MSDSGGTHGPRHDDALKKALRGELQANRATRAQEWREPEPPGDDQPDATIVLSGRPGPDRGPDRDDIQQRSDLARHLDRATFPASRASLTDTLAAHHAPQPITDLAGSLPDSVSFASLHDVLEALGLPVDSRNPRWLPARDAARFPRR